MATGALNASAPETSSTYVAPPAVSAPPPVRKGGFLRKAAWTVFVLILLAGVGFGAFTAGRTFTQREMQSQIENIKAAAVPLPSPVDPATAFDKQRRDVDANPLQAVSEMSARSNGSPMNSNDPQFLLLYGRALLLSGKAVEASDALKKSVELLKDRPQRDPLKVDAKISYAAAALRTGNWQTAQTAAKPIDDEIDNGKPAQPGADSGAAP